MFSTIFKKIKPVAISSLYYLGILDSIRRWQEERLIIVVYHRFSAEREPFKTHVDVFEKQIRFFKKKYNIISFKELFESYQGNSKLPDNSIIITIDDGYYDNYSVAFPILKKYSTKATIFLTTDFVCRNAWLWPNKLEYILKQSTRSSFYFSIAGQELALSVKTFSDWHRSQLMIFNALKQLGDEKEQVLEELAKYLGVEVPGDTTSEFRSLDWNDILEMQNKGISFGSHTCSHPILSSINNKRVIYELAESKKELERHLCCPVETICYPNGKPDDISDNVIIAARNCGYKAGVTTIPASNSATSTDRYLLNRCSLTTCNQPMMAKELVRLPSSNRAVFL